MSKELEALEELFGIAAYCNCNLDGMDETQLEKYEEKCENIKKFIEQALIQKAKQEKILDILKNKLCLELSSDYLCLKSHKGQEADYTILFFDTQEEYDLLKEWLNGTK